MRRFVTCLILILGLLFPALAQEPEGTDEGIVQQTESGLDNPQNTEPLSKNPDRVPNRLETEDKRKDTLFHTPRLDRALEPWYGFKKRLNETYGLELGFLYTSLYQKADPRNTMPLVGAGRDEAAAGVIGMLGQWNLVGRGTNQPGYLGFQVQQRHRIGPVVPQNLGLEIGSLWPTAIGYSELALSVIELYWAQFLVKDRLGFSFGKQIPFTAHDYFAYKSPFNGFDNATFGLNPAIGYAEAGLSVGVGARPTTDTYVLAAVYDGNGKLNRAGFETFFGEREYFTVVDLGWDPGWLDKTQKVYIGPLRVRDIHATIWHKAHLTKSDSPEGWGFTLFAEGEIGHIVPFLRYGYSQGTSRGNPALLDHMVAGGIGITDVFGQNNDLIGMGLSYGKIDLGGSQPVDLNGDGFPDFDLGSVARDLLRTKQYAAELFYRVQLTQELQITPSLQLIWDPILNRDESTIAVFGLRSYAGW
jgi:porin